QSHAASVALIAYARAYIKRHHLAAFTAATLNNPPMGFYQPFTIIKYAQRHGLQVLPVDVTKSDWLCAIEGVGDRVLGVEDDAEIRGREEAETRGSRDAGKRRSGDAGTRRRGNRGTRKHGNAETPR